MKWTETEIKDLKDKFPDMFMYELIAYFNKSRNQIEGKAYSLNLKKSKEHIKLVKFTTINNLKKGNLGSPLGTERKLRNGIIEVKVKAIGNRQKAWTGKHRLIWEKINGPIPKDHLLLFIDGNNSNCNIENLKLISKKENLENIHINNYPPEIKQLYILLNKIKRKCNEK